jgi:NOL1/NOP2/sun family putative RNA methylase
VKFIPQLFLERMQRLLGEEYPAFLASYAEFPLAGLRVNTLKIPPEEYQKISPYPLIPAPWSWDGFLVGGETQPGKHPYHNAGLYYLQEPSAMAAVEILAPQPGERVLDLAAAPGGKSTQIASRMQHQGLLVANEIHPKRVWELAANIERWGAHNVVITNESPERLAAHLGDFFDRVLLDAPCSGEGMFRKSETARVEWGVDLVKRCAIRQSHILEEAARLVRPGGWLVYSTCTFAPEENEYVIASFLDSHPQYDLCVPKHLEGFAPGRPEWVGREFNKIPLQHTVRIWPHHASGEGHFIALLQRQDDSSGSCIKRRSIQKMVRQEILLFRRFCQENLGVSFEEDQLIKIGTYLYQTPPSMPDLSDLKVIHPGWWLGSLKKSRFEPTHALAMGLTMEAARDVIKVAADSREAPAYLRGENLLNPGQDGWVMVAVEPGFPLGWGKRVQGVLKNFYPHGLRLP